MTKTKHILIIDDDPNLRRLFGAKLALAGYEVNYASDGNEGREMARRFKVDLILLDIRLGDTDGFKIAERLKTEPKTKHIPIAFLTNQDLTPEAEKNLKELWAVAYLHKSMDLNEFVKKINDIFKKLKVK